VLLCILTLGVGGFFVADTIVNSDQDNVAKVVEEEEEVVVEEVAVLCSLTTHVSPSGSGTINPSSGNYDSEMQVTLIATPSLGYEFNYWSGTDDNSVNPTMVTMNSNRSITAYFIPIEDEFVLSTLVSPDRSGTISRNPHKDKYEAGTRVTLTATPASGHHFVSWSGDLGSNTNPITITMDGNKMVTASFTQNKHTLSVNINGSGSVTKNPDQPTYSYGAVVTLTAIPISSYRFDCWSGDASGTSTTITITMDRDKRVVAHFKEIPPQIIIFTMPPGAIGGSTVRYSKTLKAGETVDGSVQLTGQYYSVDWSYNWTFQILGPGGESIQQWTGHWVNNNYHEFSFTASYTGTYKIRVYHASSYSKNLTIEILPPGW